jgi:DmsE family decaheme c-type cytochrome
VTARRLVWLVAILVAVGFVSVSSSHAQNKFRLKPGAAGKLCFECHDEFKAKLTAPHVHTPVKSGDCVGCHSAHTAKHGKLLSEAPSGICTTCHADIVPAKAVSNHKVVVEGNCVKCHDPHASPNKAQLLKAGNDLCLGCHKAIADTVAKVKFRHAPVTKDCLGCHNPHGSDKARRLLTKTVPDLCLDCHKADSANFARQHVNYPVAKADCTSCHDVHGSNTAGILFDSVHPPVAAKRCNQCHNPATAADAFATRRAGFELCRGCHAAMVNQAFSKNRVHWPLVDKTGCLNCHEPHASREKKLLNVSEATLCGKCHGDTVAYQARLAEQEVQDKASAKGRVVKGSLTHGPIQTGECSACHSPHASDTPRLMVNSQVVETCGACHDWLKHTSHPMGQKVVDPRNKNRSLDCLSCHRSHGTGYRFLIPYPNSTDLCVQCHRQLRK